MGVRRTVVRIGLGVLPLAAILMSGCYHAVINTGRPSSGQVIEKPWANSFVAGLVPLEVVETASKCPNGVAKVETMHSVLNMVATIVTFNIYSPMTIRVECAAGGSAAPALDVPADANRSQVEETLRTAIQQSVRSSAPVYVRFVEHP